MLEQSFVQHSKQSFKANDLEGFLELFVRLTTQRKRETTNLLTEFSTCACHLSKQFYLKIVDHS